MKMTLLALVFILGAHHLQASLGETETELIKRYGKIVGDPVSVTPKDRTVHFIYEGYNITVTLLEGQSSRETFTRADKSGFSPEQMDVLLAGNTLESTWRKMDDNENVIVWVLDSKKAFAGYYKKLSMFIVKDSDMLAFEQALQQIQQQQQHTQAAPTPDPTINRSLRP